MVIIGNSLYVNGTNVSGQINFHDLAGTPNTIDMFTITIDFDTSVLRVYVNGILLQEVTGNTSVANFVSGIAAVTSIDCLRSNAISDNVMIQHFTIYGDVASSTEVQKMYLDKLS
jgi:hypothetical protein